MSLAQLSAGVSVEQFFLSANWLGEKRVNQSSEEYTKFEDVLVPTLYFQVGEFFAHHNWQGVKQRLVSSPSTGETQESQPLCFTMKVSDFFRGIKWEGQKVSQKTLHIAQSPKVEEPDNISPPEEELNMSDLSDLF